MRCNVTSLVLAGLKERLVGRHVASSTAGRSMPHASLNRRRVRHAMAQADELGEGSGAFTSLGDDRDLSEAA
jgi:hypothetical protein